MWENTKTPEVHLTTQNSIIMEAKTSIYLAIEGKNYKIYLIQEIP